MIALLVCGLEELIIIYVKFNGSMVYAQDNDCNGSVDQLEHDVPFGHPLGNLVSASSLSDIERTLLR